MRKAVIHAVADPGSLEWSPNAERAVDRICAMGWCSPFGSGLIKLRWGLAREQWAPAHLRLAKRLLERFKGLGRQRSQLISDAVLREWLLPMCQQCGGSGSTGFETGKVSQCNICDGSGLHRFSDAQRARALRCDVSKVRHWEKYFAFGHQTLTDEEGKVWRKLGGVLGRTQEFEEIISALPLVPKTKVSYPTASPISAGAVAATTT